MELLRFLHLLQQLCLRLLKIRQLFVLFLHISFVALQASIVLLDHLLEFLVSELVHVVQTEGDLLGRWLLIVVLRCALIADCVTGISRPVLLLELGVQLLLPFVQHACTATPF